jgi:hypothetical protein
MNSLLGGLQNQLRYDRQLKVEVIKELLEHGNDVHRQEHCNRHNDCQHDERIGQHGPDAPPQPLRFKPLARKLADGGCQVAAVDARPKQATQLGRQLTIELFKRLRHGSALFELVRQALGDAGQAPVVRLFGQHGQGQFNR